MTTSSFLHVSPLSTVLTSNLANHMEAYKFKYDQTGALSPSPWRKAQRQQNIFQPMQTWYTRSTQAICVTNVHGGRLNGLQSTHQQNTQSMNMFATSMCTHRRDNINKWSSWKTLCQMLPSGNQRLQAGLCFTAFKPLIAFLRFASFWKTLRVWLCSCSCGQVTQSCHVKRFECNYVWVSLEGGRLTRKTATINTWHEKQSSM